MDGVPQVAVLQLRFENATEAIEARDIEAVFFGEFREPALVGERLKRLVEFGQLLGGLLTNPIVVVESEVVFALAVHDVADDDQRDFRDGPLAPEGGEVQFAHDADDAVALPRRQRQVVTQRVADAKFVQLVHPTAVAGHRGVALLVQSANALAHVRFRGARTADDRRARRDRSPAANRLVALKVCPANRAVPRSPTELIGVVVRVVTRGELPVGDLRVAVGLTHRSLLLGRYSSKVGFEKDS